MEVKKTECGGCKGKCKSQVFIITDKGFVCLDCLLKAKEVK